MRFVASMLAIAWEEILAMDDQERTAYDVCFDEGMGVASCWLADGVDWKVFGIMRGTNNLHYSVAGVTLEGIRDVEHH